MAATSSPPFRLSSWALPSSPVNGTFVSTQGAVLEVQYLFQNGATRSSSVPQFGLSLRGVNETFSHTLGTLNGNHYEFGVVLYY
jgi:hypothetical protein